MEYASGVNAKDRHKVWMVEFCQQLLDGMAVAVMDDSFKKELNSRGDWFFRGLTEAQHILERNGRNQRAYCGTSWSLALMGTGTVL